MILCGKEFSTETIRQIRNINASDEGNELIRFDKTPCFLSWMVHEEISVGSDF